MPRISKMDRQGVRTPADLETKYRFGKSFAETEGVARSAQATAASAQTAAEGVAKDLSGVFKKDIEMTGTFTCTTEAYLPPGNEEVVRIEGHLMGGATSQIPSSEIPLYDFNQDGVVDDQDLMLAKEYMWGRRAYETCPAAIATPVTATIDLSNPARAIRYTGTNAWGRYVEEYAGTNFSTAVNPATEERIAALEERLASLEANLGGE